MRLIAGLVGAILLLPVLALVAIVGVPLVLAVIVVGLPLAALCLVGLPLLIVGGLAIGAIALFVTVVGGLFGLVVGLLKFGLFVVLPLVAIGWVVTRLVSA